MPSASAEKDGKARELTLWTAIVIRKVWMGFMFGRTAKTVSPTRPRELEATPASLIGKFAPVN